MAKLNLKATDKDESSYSAFTKNYRTSDNVIDYRVDRTKARKTSGSTNPQYGGTSGGGTTRAANRAPSEIDQNTPDDYSFGAAEGGKNNHTTKPSQARKMDPEDAIDITSNRR